MHRILICCCTIAIAAASAACGGGSGQGAVNGTTTTTVAAPATTSTPTTTSPAHQLAVAPAPWRLPAPTSRAVLLVDGTSLVLLGGQDASHVSTPHAFAINPETGSATPVGPLNPAVHDAAGVHLGGNDLVIAGGTPPARATVQAIAPGQATRTIGQLAAPRTDHVAALVNGTVYVFAGADASEAPIASVEASPDGVTWRDAGALAEAVRYPALAPFGSVVYLFGGVGGGHADTTAIERYDPATRTATVVAQLPAPLSHACALVLGDVVWILGGFVSDAPSTQILRFDPRSAVVQAAGSLPAPITDAMCAATSATTGYLVGGEGPGRATTAAVVTLSAR